jgi:hypothetical protein
MRAARGLVTSGLATAAGMPHNRMAHERHDNDQWRRTMLSRRLRLLFASSLAICTSAYAAEGKVVWNDPTCGYFILTLPEHDRPERFGLYSWRSGDDPQMDQVWEGDLIQGQEIQINRKEGEGKMTALHWANAKEQAQLVRNTPAQCASRWKKRR